MESKSQTSLEFLRILKAEGLDKALYIAGDFHRYQWKLLIYLGIQWLITAFVLMIQPFLTQVPTFYCRDSNDPANIYECSEDASCSQGVMLGPNPPNNIVTEFGLYCDKASLRNLGGTIFFFGGGLGTLFFSYIADQYGRRKALLFAYVIGSISILIMGLAGTVLPVFYVFLGASWLGYDAYFAFSFIVVSEAGGPKLRGISNAFLLVIWGIGLCVFIGLAYLIQNWREEVLYTIAIPACVCIGFFVQIYETPRFLYAKRKYEECAEVLAKIAKENNRSPHSASLLLENDGKAFSEESNAIQADDGEDKSSQTSYLMLVKNPWLRKRFFIFTVLILYLYLAYNGILFALADIGGNIYENSIIVSAAELFSYISSIFILNNVKRKKSFMCIMLAAATGGIIFALIPYISCETHFLCGVEFLQDAMSLIIKYSVCLSFGLIYVYGSELFPTTTRSKCIGLAASIGRASGMFITWLNTGLTDLGIKPVLFYGCLGLVMLILLKWLPETYGCKLRDYIPEGDEKEELTSNEEELKIDSKSNKVKNDQAEGVY